MRMMLFDRWGVQIGTVADVLSCEWTEELNGEDTLSVVTASPVAKGNRIVWRDHKGSWHEHTVASVAQGHDRGGSVLYSATCENSISELYGDWLGDKRPENATASAALSAALEPTRWEIGTVTVGGSNSTNYYRESAREAVQKVMEAWGGELSTTIEVSGCGVAARKVNLTRRGENNGLRFEWGRNMTAIKRTFDADDVVTALYGYGKGEEVGDGYGRGIDFAAINGGKEYVEDADALEAWGRPDGKGGKAHVFGKVEFSDCEDPSELLKLTKAEHEKRKTPKVSYEASVQAFAEYGYGFDGVSIGDDVALIDRAFDPEVRVKGRVTKLVRDMLDDGKATDITIGNVIDDAADMMARQYADIKSLSGRATSWDVAAYTPPAYINQVMAGLNKEFDAGASYIYQSPEQGIVVGSVPLDQATGLPSTTPASAIQLKGGGFRIANSLKSDGTWDWRTFGNGDGFVADEIVTGILKGGNSVFDLNTGTITVRSQLDGKECSVVIGGASGMSIFAEGKLVGGLQVVDGEVCMTADTLKKPGYSNYVTVGSLSGGSIMATEFMAQKWHSSSENDDGSIIPSFAIMPLYKSAGDGHFSAIALLRNRMSAVTLAEAGARFGFRGTEASPTEQYSVSVQEPFFWVGDENNGGMRLNENRYLGISDSSVVCKWKKNWMFWMDSSGVYFNCGGKGFGWQNGVFKDSITFAPE